MNKRLLLNTLCCFSLVSGSVFANTSEVEVEETHAALGSRPAAQEYLEKRLLSDESELQEKGLKADSASLKPSEEMLADSRKCLMMQQGSLAKNKRENNEEGLVKKALYFTTHPDAMHWPRAVSRPYGDPVQLEDGSIWSICSEDSYKTLNWSTTHNILILPNRNYAWNFLYPYVLHNQQTGLSVQATYSAAPWVSYGFWIYSIDYYNCQMCLNDGSIWNVPFSDSWILNGFVPGDYVIMGFNDSPGNGLGSNILINFATMQYVYSTCIFY